MEHYGNNKVAGSWPRCDFFFCFYVSALFSQVHNFIYMHACRMSIFLATTTFRAPRKVHSQRMLLHSTPPTTVKSKHSGNGHDGRCNSNSNDDDGGGVIPAQEECRDMFLVSLMNGN